jgi:hypothetical protein
MWRSRRNLRRKRSRFRTESGVEPVRPIQRQPPTFLLAGRLPQTSVPEPGPCSQDLVSESLRACSTGALGSVAPRFRRSSRLARLRARRSLRRCLKSANGALLPRVAVDVTPAPRPRQATAQGPPSGRLDRAPLGVDTRERYGPRGRARISRSEPSCAGCTKARGRRARRKRCGSTRRRLSWSASDSRSVCWSAVSACRVVRCTFGPLNWSAVN